MTNENNLVNNYVYCNRCVSPPLKYLDIRFTESHDLKYIKLYEETRDIKVLERPVA